ncbi:hypothetical protein [Prauserella muralis]|uniref:hypothetical protein n=1 Tax=Prauserella muralis TaxID=588067 RepID=UPI0011BDFB6C|nr:hypothetical protein [Prauserella muralis]
MITRLARLLRPVANRLAPATLSLSALGCAVGAAWYHGVTTGLLGTAGALLLAEWRMVEPPTDGGRQ